MDISHSASLALHDDHYVLKTSVLSPDSRASVIGVSCPIIETILNEIVESEQRRFTIFVTDLVQSFMSRVLRCTRSFISVSNYTKDLSSLAESYVTAARRPLSTPAADRSVKSNVSGMSRAFVAAEKEGE